MAATKEGGCTTGAQLSVFTKVDYNSLNSKQKEVHNFHHIAAVLAKYGYATYPIRDDWNGGDMIARHMLDSGKEMLTIQIKGRPTFDRKYQNKKLWVGFPREAADPSSDVYIYPHDQILRRYEELRAAKGQPPLQQTNAWQKEGLYSWGSPPKDLLEILEPYRVSPWAPQPPREPDTAFRQQTRLGTLAAHASALRGPLIDWIEVMPPRGSGTTADPYVMGSGGPRLTKVALDFVEMLDQAGWLLKEFDWSAWSDASEGQMFLSDVKAVEKATEPQLAMLLTVLVRNERFAEGTLAEAFQGGLILAIAERAQALQNAGLQP